MKKPKSETVHEIRDRVKKDDNQPTDPRPAQSKPHEPGVMLSRSAPVHEISLDKQAVAINRAIDILEEIYPARVLQKKAKEEGVSIHIQYLKAAARTIDGLSHHKDMRENQ